MGWKKHTATGFTLVELIMVMVIIGIISVMVATFITAPIDQYVDMGHRAELSDIADTALRRMGREFHRALPNSIRVSGSYIEFLPTTMGGRYRKEQDCSGVCAGDVLDFSAADSSFDVIGSLLSEPAAGHELVIYNTAPDSVYAGDNVATVSAGSSTSKILFTAKLFPLESPYQRFQIISAPVTFACDSGTLWRYSGYTRQAAQPTNTSGLPLSAASNQAILASNVNCASSSFVYTPLLGLIAVSLSLTSGGDSITLYHEIHVNNTP